MIAAGIAQLKITLDEVEPAVMRRVEVPLRIRLDRLHLVFQAAIGWTNSHLYEIRARDVGWGIPDPDYGDGPLDARKARLADVLEDIGTKSLKYLYDFGDGWEHSVRVERITDAVPGIAYPRLIAATGRYPPEDVGGPWSYHDFLEAIADPTTNSTPRAWSGSARTSIQPRSMPSGSPATSPPSPGAGRAHPHRAASDLPDPRSSPDAYGSRAGLEVGAAISSQLARSAASRPIRPHSRIWPSPARTSEAASISEEF